MDKSQLVKLLVNINGPISDVDDDDTFASRIEETSKNLSLDSHETKSNIFIEEDLCDENRKLSCEWKYLYVNFHILKLLNGEISKSEINILSVQETKNVKIALQNMVFRLILKNIQPNLPYHVPTKSSNSNLKAVDEVLSKYDQMKKTIIALHRCIKLPNLRMLILPQCLRAILVATFQIAYCPLKKPSKKKSDSSCFIMTEETYARLLHDQQLFKEILEDMRKDIHPTIFVKETMVLFQSNAPVWFKKAVSNVLTKTLKTKKGVQHVALAMLDGTEDDTTKTWTILEILTKLILSCRKMPDFEQNICEQIINLLQLGRTTDRELYVFERLVVSCTKCLYSEDKELCKTLFVQRITKPLLYFTNKEHEFHNGDDVTDDIKQTARLIDGCFMDNASSLPCLPIELLGHVINVIFFLYHLTVDSTFKTTNKELEAIFIKYLRSNTDREIHDLLDNFLFGFTVTGILPFRNDVVLEIGDKIVVRNSPHSITYTTSDKMNTILKLFPIDQKVKLFGHLLKCITDKEKYLLTPQNNPELLNVEESVASAVFERVLTIHRVLTQLSEDKEVQCSLRDNPGNIIEYINNVLSSDANNSEIIFIVVMIMDNLISNLTFRDKPEFKILAKPLVRLSEETTNKELKHLCEKILKRLSDEKSNNTTPVTPASEFQKALEDLYDPLLPIRGHALLVLTNLIEKKDKEAMDRKQYLLNLFQLHLKNDDSYIYLNAVQGLAALADIFTDTVLEILCEEYADFSKKGDEAEKTRMKLGEVLVRVIKLLGDMSSKYKALLLNTFLSGTKDEDYLIRSSSLSSLGEVCRVLNYKLGTIVTEVLVCVHAVITTDKSVEARRAAVTVIRQLFVGLQGEMIEFLKEDILPIYRTLKEIYHNDKDDVMRLQAQLALEELNENVKHFVFPNPSIHSEKKIIIMN